MSQIKTTEIEGDVAVSRHVTSGGDVKVRGNARVNRNLKVDGWLEAKNIKGVNKGLFMTLDDLKESYPKPENGWIALVGATVPAPVYVGKGGEWVATGESGGELILDMAQYDQALSDLSDDIAQEAGSRIEGDEALQESINAETAARTQSEADIRQSIASEASTRAAGDGRLESMCNSLRDDFGTEASERANADNELQAAIALLRSSLDNLKESAGSDIDSIYEQLRSLRDHIEDSLSELRPVEVESEEAMARLIASGEIDDNRMYYVPESGLS